MADINAVSDVPCATAGTKLTRFNALKHGVLSRYTVLPWEDQREYQALLAALTAEHDPQGPTEEHLVEEVAGVLWRKRRLRLAEAAAQRRGLEGTLTPWREIVKAALVHLDAASEVERVVDAIRATPEDTAEEMENLDEDEAMTAKARKLLQGSRADAYDKAVAALRADTREWWQDVLDTDPNELDEGEEPATGDAAGLMRFIKDQLQPWYIQRRKELANRPLIREQAFGEALDPNRLERLSRYEVHLDRKFERTLAMLFKLKELRASPADV